MYYIIIIIIYIYIKHCKPQCVENNINKQTNKQKQHTQLNESEMLFCKYIVHFIAYLFN